MADRPKDMAEALLELLTMRLGLLPADLVDRVRATTDPRALERWVELACQVPSVDSFRQQAQA